MVALSANAGEMDWSQGAKAREAINSAKQVAQQKNQAGDASSKKGNVCSDTRRLDGRAVELTLTGKPNNKYFQATDRTFVFKLALQNDCESTTEEIDDYRSSVIVPIALRHYRSDEGVKLSIASYSDGRSKIGLELEDGSMPYYANHGTFSTEDLESGEKVSLGTMEMEGGGSGRSHFNLAISIRSLVP